MSIFFSFSVKILPKSILKCCLSKSMIDNDLLTELVEIVLNNSPVDQSHFRSWFDHQTIHSWPLTGVSILFLLFRSINFNIRSKSHSQINSLSLLVLNLGFYFSFRFTRNQSTNTSWLFYPIVHWMPKCLRPTSRWLPQTLDACWD